MRAISSPDQKVKTRQLLRSQDKSSLLEYCNIMGQLSLATTKRHFCIMTFLFWEYDDESRSGFWKQYCR